MGGGPASPPTLRTRGSPTRRDRDLGTAGWLLRASPGHATGRLSISDLAKLDAATDWLPVERVPTDVHLELQRYGKIADPFLRTNEAACQWVGERAWVMRCDVDLGDEDFKHLDLVFDGLDTFAHIYLDGQHILSSDNMFVPVRLPMGDRNGRHRLMIHFESPLVRARELQDQYGHSHQHVLSNGEASRLFVRKAQYHFGWDWGPKLLAIGPWRPIRLESYSTRLDELCVAGSTASLTASYPLATVHADLSATVFVSWTTVGSDASLVSLRLDDPSGRTVVSKHVAAGCDGIELVRLAAGEFELWWPAGLGEQPLYTVHLAVRDVDGRVLDRRSLRIGFRRVELIQAPLEDEPEPSRSFVFAVNGQRIFAAGANWIPADSFSARPGLAVKQRRLLEMAKGANMNMIRVWGGGMLEPDDFYDACDELGLLLWHDFAFACGNYPAHPSFVESVKAEATCLLRRLRHRPALVLLAGGNENYAIAEQAGVPRSDFPAREIFERVLPELVKRELRPSSQVAYRTDSPYSSRDLPSGDPRLGDQHCWDVWHGAQRPYQDWNNIGGRFVSEFGMQGAPDGRTVDHWLDGDLSERFPQSETMSAHNKAIGADRRLALYIAENFRVPTTTMNDYIYATQLLQAEALTAAFTLWRRRFGGHGRELTSGALVWQLDDCWPCMSWSIIDSLLRPKPAYFAIRRAIAPLAVALKRTTTSTPLGRHTAAVRQQTSLAAFAFNATRTHRRLIFHLRKAEFISGHVELVEERRVDLPPCQSTELGVWDTGDTNVRAPVVYEAQLRDLDTDELVHRLMNWPEPLCRLYWPSEADTALSVSPDESAQRLSITAARPVKGLIFSFATGSGGVLDDNALDLMPGETYTIDGRDMTLDALRWRHLGQTGAQLA